MGDQTGIGWCDKTWNPWHGCHRVSPGCDYCYMFASKHRYGQDPETVVRAGTTFDAPRRWHAPARVFTCSWSDWFIAEADPWRDEAWAIIEATPHLTYQVLTKRPTRIRSHLSARWPWPHVWLGVSIESAQYLHRADGLREIPAAVRFLSLEPLLADLGPLNLDGIGWVIVGGESGPRCRPFKIAWLEQIADRCREATVPLYVKQGSCARPGQQGDIPDDLWAIKEFPQATEAGRP